MSGDNQNQNKILMVIQAVAMTFLVFVLFNKFVKKPEKQTVVANQTVVSENVSGPKTALKVSSDGVAIFVDTPLYKAEISSVNGYVKSFYVKKYDAELVSDNAKKAGVYPLTTISNNEELNNVLLSENLSYSANKLVVKDSPETLTLKGTLSDGKIFEKTLTFYPDSYKISVKTSISDSKENLLTIVGPGIKLNEAHTSRMGHIGPVVEIADGKVERIDVKKVKNISFNGVKWAGEEDKYFITAVKDTSFSVDIARIGDSSIVKNHISSFDAYFGPKELKQLEKLGMDKAIDFGFFGFLAKPMLKFFLFLHDFIPNYGLVIIVLTLLIKIILHPLTHKSYESMKNMQKMAPKLEEIKKKYKDNPQKLNEETMKLYKEEGINPMGGCLPMVLQIPIFFTLYEIFLNAVELKGAHFLWIKDLAQPDPTYVLPVLMGISMILQQKMTPTANPDQQKIFYVMAIVFTFMFLNFPAGLVLYWFTNNLITAAQNFIINRTIHEEES